MRPLSSRSEGAAGRAAGAARRRHDEGPGAGGRHRGAAPREAQAELRLAAAAAAATAGPRPTAVRVGGGGAGLHARGLLLRLHVARARVHGGAQQHARTHSAAGLVGGQPDAGSGAVRRDSGRLPHRVAGPQDYHLPHRAAFRHCVVYHLRREQRVHGVPGPHPLGPLCGRHVPQPARLHGRDHSARGAGHAGPHLHNTRQHRHSAVLRPRQVPRLALPGADGRAVLGAVRGLHLVRPRNAALVPLQRAAGRGGGGAALAARRRGRRRGAGAARHRAGPGQGRRGRHRPAAQRHQRQPAGAGLALRQERPGAALHARQHAARRRRAGPHALPAVQRHQRRHLLHGQDLPGRGQHHRRVREHDGGGRGEPGRRGAGDGAHRPSGAADAAGGVGGRHGAGARHPGHLLLPQHPRRRRRQRLRLAAARQLRRLRGGLLRGLRAHPLAHDGRNSTTGHPRAGGVAGHGRQLVVHVRGDEDVRGRGGGRGQPRGLLGLLRRVRGRPRVRVGVRARDARPHARRHPAAHGRAAAPAAQAPPHRQRVGGRLDRLHGLPQAHAHRRLSGTN